MKFIDLLIVQEISMGEIDIYIDFWHKVGSKSFGKLHDFLGMTLVEFELWESNPSNLIQIIENRKGRY